MTHRIRPTPVPLNLISYIINMRKINPYLLVRNGRTSVFILLSFIGQLLFHNLQAQNPDLNRINNLIANAKTDTGRITLNIKKISILRRNNLDTALYLGKLQLREAEKLHFYPAIIKLHSQLADSYLFKGDFDSAKVHIQFIERNVKPSDSPNIANVYGSYGMMYGMQGIYDSCIRFYEKAIGINERTNNSAGLATEYASVSLGYQQMGNFYKALEYQQKALRLAETEKDEELRGKTILNMANTYEL